MKQKLIIAKYKKLTELQTDLNLVTQSLHYTNHWSNHFITLSNKQDDIYEQIRKLKNEISKLEQDEN